MKKTTLTLIAGLLASLSLVTTAQNMEDYEIIFTDEGNDSVIRQSKANFIKSQLCSKIF